MRRILAEVTHKQWIEDRGAPGSLPWRTARCLVRVIEPVPDTHALPAGIKDTTTTIIRHALFDSEYEPGSKVILTPDECRPLTAGHCDIPDTGSLRGKVITFKTDINGDGFAERVMENSFIRVVIGPRFGARIWEVWHKRRDSNVLYQSYQYCESSHEMGGQQDSIKEHDGHGEFWKSEFAEKEVKTDEAGCRAVYEFKSEKTKGLTIVKEIVLPPDAPLVYYRCVLKYAGAEKPPEDGKPDELEATYWTRVGVAWEAAEDYCFTSVVPTRERLRIRPAHLRHWDDFPKHYDISAPYELGINGSRRIATALLFDHSRAKCGLIYDGPWFTSLEPLMKPVTIAKGGETSFGNVITVADRFHATTAGLTMATVGPAADGVTPLFALSTECAEGEASATVAGGAVSVSLAKLDRPDLPEIGSGTCWIECGVDPDSISDLASGGRTWSFADGGLL